jgi:hypothetical protein
MTKVSDFGLSRSLENSFAEAGTRAGTLSLWFRKHSNFTSKWNSQATKEI